MNHRPPLIHIPRQPPALCLSLAAEEARAPQPILAPWQFSMLSLQRGSSKSGPMYQHPPSPGSTAPTSSVPPGSARSHGSSWSSIQESFTESLRCFQPRLFVGMKWPPKQLAAGARLALAPRQQIDGKSCAAVAWIPAFPDSNRSPNIIASKPSERRGERVQVLKGPGYTCPSPECKKEGTFPTFFFFNAGHNQRPRGTTNPQPQPFFFEQGPSPFHFPFSPFPNKKPNPKQNPQTQNTCSIFHIIKPWRS